MHECVFYEKSMNLSFFLFVYKMAAKARYNLYIDIHSFNLLHKFVNFARTDMFETKLSN